MRPIVLEFEGKKYHLPIAAYEHNRVALPDGRVLRFAGWYESLPPQPGTPRVIDVLPVAVEVAN